MKYTGITRRLDHLGRICLPMEIRKNLDIKENDPIDIYMDGETICLSKHPENICTICQKTEQLMDVKGAKICRICAIEVISKFSED